MTGRNGGSSSAMLTISNLSPIPLQGPHLLGLDVILGRLHDAHRRLPIFLQLLEECVPDPVALLVLEVGVVDLHVDARHEGLVKGSDAVGREKQDALIIFQRAKETSDEVVSLDVLN